MARSGTPGIRWAAILAAVLGAATAGTALWQWSVHSKLNTIAQIRTLPDQSVVHMAGRLLVGDAAHSQLWIEDGTGTLPILLGSTLSGNSGVAAAYAGKDVLIDGTKSAGLGPTTVTESAGSRTNLGKTGLNHAKSAPSPSLTKKNAAGGQKPAAPAATSTPVAAAATQVIVANIQPDYPQQIVLALAAGFGVSLLLALSWKIGAQRAALSRASESTHALRALAVAVQRLTRDASYDAEVPVQGDPEVAPLAIGFNAMLAELSQRDKARRDAESRLQHWALIDDLTGLPNRRLLSDRLSQSLTKAERDQNMVALLFMDLDGFKLVNDSMGHATGDALLAEVAQRLRDRFRLSDTIARIGGDEFALVLERIQERSDVQKAAEDLQELLKAPFYVNGQGIQTSACIGISLYPDSNERGQLLQQADCAMYAAKRSGRGRIVQFSDQLGSAARERLTMEGELQHAIAKGEISVLYQPEYDLLTNTIVRFEALARWTHPGLGKIMPMSFIPVAEENGQIIPLGMFVMERACNEAMAWQDIAQRPVQVAVNVSTVQFGRDSFFEEVADVLHRTGLHPSLLQIELTESATVAGVERAAEMMRRLKRMGVSVAVDDFGTGYSCLSYLPKLSFDAVKLDKSFVHELMERRETRSFVKSILELAHNLHMKVIAEGVETRQQLNLIRSLGTDEAQGFLLGRPSADPAELLRQERAGVPMRLEEAVPKHAAIL